MRSISTTLTEQDGSVIMIIVVILMAVTALGLTMINMGSSEQEMAANEKFYEDSFYDADSCVQVTAKFLRHLSDEDDNANYGIPPGSPLAPGVIYPTSVGDYLAFHHKIMRTKESFEDASGPFVFAEDLGFNPNLLAAQADIRPTGAGPSEGTAGLQENAGYSAGIGLGGAGSGGFNEWYIIACEGRGLGDASSKATTTVFGRYRKVPGIPGGL